MRSKDGKKGAHLLGDSNVRMELTEINNLTTTTYLMLACDPNPDVRYSLASNANIPVFILQRLSEDENVYVSCRAQRTIRRIAEEEAKVKHKTEETIMPSFQPAVFNLGRAYFNI